MSLRVVQLVNHDIGLRIHGRHYFNYLRSQGYTLSAICTPGEYVTGDMVTEDGIPVKAIPFWPRYTPLHDLRSLMQLLRYFRRCRFDIVHTHTVKPGLLGRLAARLTGAPVIVHTVHGFHMWDDMTPFEQWMFLQIERLAAGWCDLMLSQNYEDITVAVQQRICPVSKIRYLGNGIDVNYFHPRAVSPAQAQALRRSLGVLPHEKLVGMIGRLVRLKGYHDYVAAARLLHEQGAPIKFLTIGFAIPESPTALSPAEMIRQHGLAGTLLHLGPRRDVRELMAAMDAVVLASYAEGIPRVLMEAAAMARPAVGTDVRGTREVIVDGETGVLAPVRDPAGLAASIVRVLADPARAQAMGRAARRRAEQHFDERFFFWRTDQAYRDLVQKKLSSRHLADLNALPAEATAVLA